MSGRSNQNVAICLRRYRRSRGLNQNEVAQILQLKSASIVSRWEHAAQMPSTVNLVKLAVIYRTMTDAFLLDVRRQWKDELLRAEHRVLQSKRTDRGRAHNR